MGLIKLARRTLRSLTHKQLLGIMLFCAFLALTVVVLLVGGLTWLTADLVHVKWGWLDTSINWFTGIVLGIGGWFMLPALVVLVAGVFQEVTISQVEKIEYPDKTREDEPHFWPDVLHDIRFTVKAILLNMLVLPFYLVGIGFFLSIALNSYLLGREFFESAAGYHLGKPEARQIGRKHRKTIYSSGIILTLLTLVPLVNLFVPVIAIVWMVHLYHSLNSPV